MGQPTKFDGCNTVMRAPEGAENVQDMHVFRTRHSCVSCWEISPAELAEINSTGRVFLSVLMGGQQPPVYVGSESACRDVLVDFGPVWPLAPRTPSPSPDVALSISALQRAHVDRQEEWCPDQKPDLSFRGNELGGECGEAQNVIKKLERERHGWRGSRDTIEHLGEELADVIHCAVLVAITAGIDLEPAVIAKFNSTSEKNGLATMLAAATEVDHG